MRQLRKFRPFLRLRTKVIYLSIEVSLSRHKQYKMLVVSLRLRVEECLGLLEKGIWV